MTVEDKLKILSNVVSALVALASRNPDDCKLAVRLLEELRELDKPSTLPPCDNNHINPFDGSEVIPVWDGSIKGVETL